MKEGGGKDVGKDGRQCILWGKCWVGAVDLDTYVFTRFVTSLLGVLG